MTQGIAAVLLDIEGTTTRIAFVYDVLFPYARRHVRSYIDRAHASAEFAEIVTRLAAEHARDLQAGEHVPEWRAATPDDTRTSVEQYAIWLMDRDRKSPGLKLLQGLIWEQGYRSGELRGEVFRDVPAAMRRWRASGRDIAIYSSGSVLAQRRLFESLPDGDLTPLIAGFFDTGVGPKTAAASYASICRALQRAPGEVLFVSDVTGELAAARSAGLQVRLSIRPGNLPQPGADAYDVMEWTRD